MSSNAHKSWPNIGTIVGDTSTDRFVFAPRSMQIKLGDIVVTALNAPTGEAAPRELLVWGRVVSLGRMNPFFPAESAQELADAGVSLLETVLSTSRDQLDATVLVLGTTALDRFDLAPLSYPVQPGAPVYYPPADVIEKFLSPGVGADKTLEIGSLIGRQDVPVAVAANRVVARHMAILAMTGGGKTVAARRIIRELADKKFPLVVFDPHGDYLGLYQKQGELGVNVRIFSPKILLERDDHDTVFAMVSKWGFGLTAPQIEALGYMLSRVPYKRDLKQWLQELRAYGEKLKGSLKNGSGDPDADSLRPMTVNVVNRTLRRICEDLQQMENQNGVLKERLKDYRFEELPDLSTHPHEVAAKGQISILYLGGYNHLTQSVIVSMVLENLFNTRAKLNNQIPPFFCVVEEAHNFVPSRSEGTDETPSLATIRKVITEGRKFGTGLLLISQRPSRLDETILSQCNTYLVLRLVNPRDQNFVQRVMENLSAEDSKLLASFGPGQGLVSGQAVRFPLLVKINFDADLETPEIGAENYIEAADEWKPSATQVNASQTLAGAIHVSTSGARNSKSTIGPKEAKAGEEA